MKLYLTSRSPFVRKVKIIAIEKNITLEDVIVDLQNKPAALLEANPLGTVPTLVTDDGKSIYDSPVICEYLDGLDGVPQFFPTDFGKKMKAAKAQALADGMIESALKIFFERAKDASLQDKALIDKNFSVLERGFAALENKAPKLQLKDITISEAAIVSALGYIGFRITDLKWQDKAPILAKWYSDISSRPSVAATVPRMD